MSHFIYIQSIKQFQPVTLPLFHGMKRQTYCNSLEINACLKCLSKMVEQMPLNQNQNFYSWGKNRP